MKDLSLLLEKEKKFQVFLSKVQEGNNPIDHELIELYDKSDKEMIFTNICRFMGIRPKHQKELALILIEFEKVIKDSYYDRVKQSQNHQLLYHYCKALGIENHQEEFLSYTNSKYQYENRISEGGIYKKQRLPGFGVKPTFSTNCPHIQTDHYEILKDEDSNCWEHIIEFGYSKNSLEFLLKYDKLDLVKVVSARKSFDFSMKLKLPEMRVNDIGLPHFCAFYGAENCFQFFINNYDFHDEDEFLFSLAIIGCNQNIIDYCVEKNLPMTKCIECSIEYYYYDRYIWLLSRTSFNPTNIFIIIKFHNILFLEDYFKKMEINHINEKDSNDNTCLHIAVMNNDPLFVEILLSRGVDSNALNKSGKTSLQLAAIQGSIHIIEILLSHQTEANTNNKQMIAALDLVGINNQSHLPVIKFFFSKGMYQISTTCRTLLNLSIKENDIEFIITLLSKGSGYYQKETNQRRSDWEKHQSKLLRKKPNDLECIPPVHLAVESSNFVALELLVSKGFDVNITNDEGLTPLHLASKNRNLCMVEFLSYKGADINAKDKDSNTPLHYALLLKIENVFEKSPIVGFPKMTTAISSQTGIPKLKDPLYSYDSTKATIEFLVSKGADWTIHNKDRKTPFQLAIERCYIPTIEYFIHLGADITTTSIDKHALLDSVITRNDIKFMHFLLYNGFDINDKDDNGWTLLHSASFYGKESAVKILVQKADVNAQDKDGITPLHLASYKSNISVVHLLIRKNAKINEQDSYGLTPLHYSLEKLNPHSKSLKSYVPCDLGIGIRNIDTKISNINIEIIDFLVNNGADCHILDNDQESPFQLAIKLGQIDIVKSLISRGEGIMKNCMEDVTPLLIALDNGHNDIVEFFLSNGANINATDANGLTPLHKAVFNGNKSGVELLLSKGAEVNTFDTHDFTPLHVAFLRKQRIKCQVLSYKGMVLNCSDHLCVKKKKDTSDVKKKKDTSDVKKKEDTSDSSLNQIRLPMRTIGNINLQQKPKLLVPNQNLSSLLCNNQTKPNLELIQTKPNLELIQTKPNLELIQPKPHPDEDDVMFSIIQLLLSYGADVIAQKNGNFTPLHLASISELRFVELLTKEPKTFVDSQGKFGLTPLHLAAFANQFLIVEFLVKNEADVNAITVDKLTPFHIACHLHHLDIFDYLLLHGASIDVQNPGFFASSNCQIEFKEAGRHNLGCKGFGFKP